MINNNDDDIENIIWVEYLHEDGKPYYYNKVTKETLREASSDYIQWKDNELEKYLININSNWRFARDNNGQQYYYNDQSTTQWNAPSVISEYLKYLIDLTVKRKDIIPNNNNDKKIIKKRKERDDDDDGFDDDYEDNNDYVNNLNTTSSSINNNNNNYGNWDDDDDFDDYNNNNYYENFNNNDDDDNNNDNDNDIHTPTGTPPPDGTPINSPFKDDDNDNDNDNYDNKNDNQQEIENSTMDMDMDDTNNNETILINEEEQRKSSEMKDLETKLNVVDSIMNTDIISTCQRLVQLSDEPGLMAKKISTLLADNYVGYAQMTHLLLDWFHCAQEADVASSSSIQTINVQDSESLAVDEISGLIKQSFHKDKADELINLFVTSAEASEWFTKLIDDSTLRRTLIELYDKNRGSTLLAHSIKMLSSMGYNREIAQIIREVDYIEVFNELLLDLLTRVVQSSDESLQSLADDLKRMCCHTDFMFAYSHYLLLYIEQLLLLDTSIEEDFGKAAQIEESEEDKKRKETLSMQLWGDEDEDDDDNEQKGSSNNPIIKTIYDGKKVQSIRHKVRRLRQELELSAIWNKRDEVSGRLTNVGQFGLKMIGLQKVYPTDNSNQNSIASVWFEFLDMLKTNTIEAVHIDRLNQYYLKNPSGSNTKVDANQLKQVTIPICFLRESQIFKMLIDALVHPSKQLSTNNIKTARLLALAYCYNDGTHADNTDIAYYGFIGNKSSSSNNIQIDKDYEKIAKELSVLEEKLLTISELCNGVIKMAYSILSFDKPYMIVELMENPLISMCVISWIRSCLTDNDFTSKALNINLLPFFFAMIIASIEHHPSQHPDCLDIIKIVFKLNGVFDSHDNNTGSSKLAANIYNIITAQNDAIECIVFLMGSGYVNECLIFICQNVDTFDIKNIRHLLHKLLNSITTPFSKYFLSKFCELLCNTSVVKALTSSYFTVDDAITMKNIIEKLEEKDFPNSNAYNQLQNVIAQVITVHKL